MDHHSKFLVHLFEGFTRKEVFFLVWFTLVSAFVWPMVRFYQNQVRRNFRTPGDGPPPRATRVEPRRLEEGHGKNTPKIGGRKNLPAGRK